MADPDSSAAVTPELSDEDKRHELQAILGELHGLLTTIVQRLLPLVTEEEMKDLVNDITRASPGVSLAFGEVQGELNTGSHDGGLAAVALTSEQLEPKKRGFRFNSKRLYGALTNLPRTAAELKEKKGFIAACRHALRGVKWGNIIIGSLSREIVKFKGVEVIREFGEVIMAFLEQVTEQEEAESAAGSH